MRRDFATNVAGGFFLAAAMMLWGGWMIMPHHIGMLFQADDFAAIHPYLHVWLWLYRVHIFGMVTSILALVALAAVVADSPARVLVWPGVVVAAAGFVVGAVGSAFYYHFGVWGAIQMHDKSAEEAGRLVDSLLISTEYVTCLVRFGRVFAGLGLLVLSGGLLKWNILPAWIGASAALIGVAAMAIVMLLPDNWPLYMPVFHAQALWLFATGIVILKVGVNLTPDAPPAA